MNSLCTVWITQEIQYVEDSVIACRTPRSEWVSTDCITGVIQAVHRLYIWNDFVFFCLFVTNDILIRLCWLPFVHCRNRTITREHSLPEICHLKQLLSITVTAQNKLLTAHGAWTDGLSDSFTLNRVSLPFLLLLITYFIINY